MTTTEIEPTFINPESETYDEQELIQLFRDGDAQAFTVTFSEHRDFVENYVYRNYHIDLHTAEDITQNTFLKAFEKRGTFRNTNNGGTRPWLAAIARNEMLGYLRKQTFRPRIVDYELVDSDIVEQDSAEIVISRMAAQAIEQAAKSMSDFGPERIEAIIACAVDKIPVDEYAESIGISENTVKTRIHRGRRAAKAAYGTSASMHTALFSDN